MGIENWAKSPGLPPNYVNVLNSVSLDCYDCKKCEEVVLIEGKLPHMGIPHNGLSGDETIVIRRRQSDGNWRIRKPIDPQIYIHELFNKKD